MEVNTAKIIKNHSSKPEHNTANKSSDNILCHTQILSVFQD